MPCLCEAKKWPNSWARRMVKRVSENGSPSNNCDGFSNGSTPLNVAPDTMVVAAVSKNSIIGTRTFGLCRSSPCVDAVFAIFIRKSTFTPLSPSGEGQGEGYLLSQSITQTSDSLMSVRG